MRFVIWILFRAFDRNLDRYLSLMENFEVPYATYAPSPFPHSHGNLVLSGTLLCVFLV